ncbi:MAG: hypothetical protein MJ188_06060 [Treponema sp.]|nr:hypothetical protein [Treponema sp.]
MNKNTYYQEIYNRFGAVTRARNCFLYTKKNVRLTDLYQENGRAILGWDAGNAFTFFKNTMNRGQVGSFITEEQNKTKRTRLEKAVSTLLQDDFKVLFFGNKTDAIKCGLLFSSENTSIYKPWNPENVNYSKNDSVVISPCFPWTDSIYITAIKTALLEEKLPEIKDLLASLNSISVPFALQSGITRAIYNLIAEIPLRQEKDWFLYDTVLNAYFTRKGPYLYPKVSKEQYDSFLLHCMDCELLFNPDYNGTSIIPFGADKGVFTKLKNNPFLPTNN